MNKKNLLVIIIIVIVIGGGYFLLADKSSNNLPVEEKTEEIKEEENMNNNTNVYEISGMKVEVLKEGTGEVSKTGDTVFVHYTGTLENGVKFDSSVDKGTPFDFTVGQNRVIQGGELGVVGMKVGEKRKLTIPPELGYGSQGAGEIIPPNATLIFEVELLKIN